MGKSRRPGQQLKLEEQSPRRDDEKREQERNIRLKPLTRARLEAVKPVVEKQLNIALNFTALVEHLLGRVLNDLETPNSADATSPPAPR